MSPNFELPLSEWRAAFDLLADRKVIAVGTIPELLALDHPWIQEYFNGPRGRAAKASTKRAKALPDVAKAVPDVAKAMDNSQESGA